MTPTREQLIEQAILGHAGTRMAMQWLFDQAHGAGRAQGLREAREVVQSLHEKVADPIFGQERHDVGHAVIDNCAAAIQQLEGRPR